MENKHIGQKIREFRTRAGKSQLQLEVEIGAAPGSLSRIESGKTNPSKETIFTISKSLNLTDRQISYLFGLDFDTPQKVLSIVNKISGITDIDTVMQVAVNEISTILDYVSVSILLLDESNTLRAQYFAQNQPSIEVMRRVGVRFNSLYVNESTDKDNLLLRTALDKRIHRSSDMYDFGRGAISKPLMRMIQKVVSLKEAISIPLIAGEDVLGSIFFAKKDLVNYEFELDLLEALARQVAYAIRLSQKRQSIS